MQKPLISIIIPVYNTEKYLPNCLDSVINQTYKNLEIILVDDGSTDKSSEICDEYAQKDFRIKLIHKENGGVSSARNAGLALVSGDYIAWVDSDDFVAPDYIEYMYKLLKEYDADISSCRNISFRDSSEKQIKQNIDSSNCNISIVDYSKTNKKKPRVINNKNDIMTTFVIELGTTITTHFWNKLFKKKLYNNIRVIGDHFDDAHTLYKILAKSNKYVVGEELKYFYRFVETGNSKILNVRNLNRIYARVKQKEFIINNFPELYDYASANIIHFSNLIIRKLIRRNYNSSKFLNSIFENVKAVDFLKKAYKDNLLQYLKIFKAPIQDKILAVFAYISIPITVRIYRTRFHNDFWITKVRNLFGSLYNLLMTCKS